MLTRSISVSCADESLGFGDDRDFAGPRPLTRGLAPPPRETSEPSNEMSTTHAVVRARGCGAGGAQPVGAVGVGPVFRSLNKPFFLKCKCLRLKDNLEHGLNLRVIARTTRFGFPVFATNYA